MRLYPGGDHLYKSLMSLKFPGGNILQHPGQSRLKLFKRKVCADTLPSPLPHFTGARRIRQERLERAGEKRSVTVRDERAGHAILNHFRRATVGAANHGLGIRHRLQEYQAETFPAAGQREHIAVCITCEELLLRESEKKTNMVRHAGL